MDFIFPCFMVDANSIILFHIYYNSGRVPKEHVFESLVDSVLI